MTKWRELLSNPGEKTRRAARGVAVSSALFVLVLSALLVVNYLQVRSVDPLNSRALNRLLRELRANPGDRELAEEIRALNLLSRKAFITHRRQLQAGGVLLLAGLAVCLVAVRLGARPRRALPDLSRAPSEEDFGRDLRRSRRWVLAGGASVLAAAVVAGLLFHSDLEAEQPFTGAGRFAAAKDYQANWAAFRGPGGNGVAASAGAPSAWDGASGKGVLWKVEVPRQGYSSPVIWGTRLFVTGADEKTRELYCYDTETGKLLWQRPVGTTGEVPTIHRDTGYAASSAATNGRQVFAVFATGDLACFDVDGTPRWSQSLGLPENHYGHASSLVTFEDLLIVQYDQNAAARLLALDAETGTVAWQADRSVISWSSPILVDTGKRTELILTNSAAVSSYDPRTGTLFWESKCLGGEMGPSAAYDDGMVFAANDFAQAVGLRLTDGAPQQAWTFTEKLPDTASPLAANGLVFLATSKGDILCLDGKTGAKLWEQAFSDGFYASPVLAGDRVYAMDLRGVMHIFRAGRTWQPVAEAALGEPSSCTVAVLRGRVYARGDRYLYCITGA